jgi:predicted RNA polymerase sigma factor
LGDLLAALDRPQEARQSYARALTLAQTIEPEFQVGWVKHLEKKLAQ